MDFSPSFRRLCVSALAIAVLTVAIVVGHLTRCVHYQLTLVDMVGFFSAILWAMSAVLAMEGTHNADTSPAIWIFGSEWTNFGAAIFTGAAVILQMYTQTTC